MNAAQKEIKNLLKTEFSRLRAKNPSFSLRAFARRLDIPVSALSGILNGRLPITKKTGEKVVAALLLDKTTSAQLLAGLKYRTSSKDSEEDSTPNRDEVIFSMDVFHMFADWYSSAIFSLFETKDFNPHPQSISRRLGISQKEVQETLERLERLGCLVRDNKGQLKATGKDFTAPGNAAGAYRQKHHQEFMELAMQSLMEDNPENCSFSGITMAIDPKKIPEAKRRLTTFRKSLCKFLEGGDQKQVFRMNIQLFAISDRKG